VAIKFPNTRRKRRSVHDDDNPASTPEVGNKTPKRRRYGDKDVSLRVLEDMNAGVVIKLKKEVLGSNWQYFILRLLFVCLFVA